MARGTPGCLAAAVACLFGLCGDECSMATPSPSLPNSLEPVLPCVLRYRDAVNVYVLRLESGRTVLFDLGSGDVLDALARAGLSSPAMVFHTDYRRDRTFGHHTHPGLPVAVGEIDAPRFREAERLWREVSVFHSYVDYGAFWMPRRGIAVHTELRDGSLPIWDKPYVYAQHTPAHTPGGMSYLVVDGDKRYVVCGDLMQSDGTLHSVFELQRTYNFMEGLHGVRRAVGWMATADLDAVLPAHGEPLVGRHAIRRACEALLKRIDRFWGQWRLIWPDQPPGGVDDFAPVTPHFRSATNRISHALVDDEGHALLFDTGVGYPDGFERALAAQGIRDVEVVLITHHHDDHVMGWEWLQQHFRPRLGAHSCMADVLRNPRAYALNCLHDRPLPLDIVLEDAEPFKWRGHTIRAYHFPSQTEYHCAYFVEVDGRRVLVSGDALYWEPDHRSIRPTDPDWRNRFDVDTGYLKCAPLLRRLKPDLLAAAHVAPWPIEPQALERFEESAGAFHEALRDLVGRRHPALGIDPFWLSIYPYRASIAPGEAIEVEVRLDNPLDRTASVRAVPRLPEGVTSVPGEFVGTAAAKSRLTVPLRLVADQALRIDGRAVWTLEATFDGEALGEPAEALLEAPDFVGPGDPA